MVYGVAGFDGVSGRLGRSPRPGFLCPAIVCRVVACESKMIRGCAMIRPLLIGACMFVPLVSDAASAPPPWVRVEATGTRLRQLGEAVPAGNIDYGRFQWQPATDADVHRLRAKSIRVEPSDAPFVLDLGGIRFDPTRVPPSFAQPWGSPAEAKVGGSDLRLVQFSGPIRQSELDALRGAGLVPVQYIHPFTYVVWGTRAALQRSAARSSVRWSGDFLPAYRVLPRWRALDAATIDAHVLVFHDADGVREMIAATGARTGAAHPVGGLLDTINVRVAGDRIAQIASIAGVYSVQPVPRDGGLRGEMSDQVNAGNVDDDHFAVPGYLAYLADIGVDGNGVVISDVDGGIYDTHPDLVHRMLPCTGDTCGGTATDSHGTHTAGIMAGDGSSGVLAAGFLRGLGMAPGANLVEQLYDPTFTEAGGMLRLMTDSVRNHAVMSGNSWGPAGTPRGYDGDTRQVDVGVRDADPDAPGDQPLNYVLSFMNGGGGTSSQGTPDEGKNMLTIGSTWMQDSSTVQNPDIDDLSSNTAHGPALDGRSIPAMVAPGCDVDSSISASGYGLLCGTSMASPHVTGASALFVEYYRNQFGTDPSPALTKAAFTAVAKNLTGHQDADGHVMTHLFDSKQGWGRMQITPVLAPDQPVQYVDQNVILDNTGDAWLHTYTAADPGQPIRIMLAWTDAPGHGLGGSTPAWNNNLDLRVTANGTTYRGNVLDAAGWSQSGGTADAMNNTEAVFLQPAQHAGSVTIDVLASDINSDGVPSSGDDTDQDFALVCYNCADAAAVDLALEVRADPDPALPGHALTYAIDVSNLSINAASATRVTFDASPGTTLDSFEGTEWTCALARQAAVCDYAPAITGGSAAAALGLTVGVASTAVGPLMATVSVRASGADSNMGNNAVEVVTTLVDRVFADGFDAAPAP